MIRLVTDKEIGVLVICFIHVYMMHEFIRLQFPAKNFLGNTHMNPYSFLVFVAVCVNITGALCVFLASPPGWRVFAALLYFVCISVLFAFDRAEKAFVRRYCGVDHPAIGAGSFDPILFSFPFARRAARAGVDNSFSAISTFLVFSVEILFFSALKA